MSNQESSASPTVSLNLPSKPVMPSYKHSTLSFISQLSAVPNIQFEPKSPRFVAQAEKVRKLKEKHDAKFKKSNRVIPPPLSVKRVLLPPSFAEFKEDQEVKEWKGQKDQGESKEKLSSEPNHQVGELHSKTFPIKCQYCTRGHNITPLSKQETKLMRVGGAPFGYSYKIYFCDLLCHLRWKDLKSKHPWGSHKYGYMPLQRYNLEYYWDLQMAHPEWKEIPWLNAALDEAETVEDPQSTDWIEVKTEDKYRDRAPKQVVYQSSSSSYDDDY